MLNLEETGRLRDHLHVTDRIVQFEGYRIGQADIVVGQSDKNVIEQQVTAGRLRAPEQIFGTPFDVSCMDGIGDWTVHAPQKRSFVVEKGRIIGSAAVLSVQNDFYVPNPVVTSRELQRAELNIRSGYQGFALRRLSEERARCAFATRLEPRLISMHATFFSNLESGNYGSFMFRQLPQMLFLREYAASCDCYVVAARTPWYFEALRLLGFPAKPSFTVKEICGETFSSVTFTNEFDAEGFLQADTVQQISGLAFGQDQYVDRTSPEKIYVSRALSGITRTMYRHMTNEAEVEEVFKSKGFEVVYPETLSFSAQISKFRSAKYIAGPSGSGMFNSIFAPAGCRILDIESFHNTVRQHAKFYSSTGRAYAFLFGRLDPDDGSHPISRRYRVEFSDLIKGIEWLLSAA